MLVQVCQIAELARVQTVSLDVLKGPLHLTLPFWHPRRQRVRPEPVVRRERQEPRLIDRSTGLAMVHDRRLVVVQDLFWHSTKSFGGGDVRADQRVEVLALTEVDEVPTAESQDKAEALDDLCAGDRERDVVRRPVLLALRTGRGFEGLNRLLLRLRTEQPQPRLDDRVPAVEAFGC